MFFLHSTAAPAIPLASKDYKQAATWFCDMPWKSMYESGTNCHSVNDAEINKWLITLIYQPTLALAGTSLNFFNEDSILVRFLSKKCFCFVLIDFKTVHAQFKISCIVKIIFLMLCSLKIFFKKVKSNRM